MPDPRYLHEAESPSTPYVRPMAATIHAADSAVGVVAEASADPAGKSGGSGETGGCGAETTGSRGTANSVVVVEADAAADGGAGIVVAFAASDGRVAVVGEFDPAVARGVGDAADGDGCAAAPAGCAPRTADKF